MQRPTCGSRLAIIATAGTADEPSAAACRAARSDDRLPTPIGVVELHGSPGLGARATRLPRLGTTTDLASLVDRHALTHALVALPPAMSRAVADIERTLKNLGIHTARYASVSELFAHAPADHHDAEDLAWLLGRAPRPLDHEAVRHAVTDQRVLITGAGGSIGSELARIVASRRPSELVVMDRSENALFEIDRELGARFPDTRRRAVLHDVVDYGATQRRLLALRPDVVFHAAAHKHVPLMEDHPAAAVRNNIFGTRSVADGALACGSSRFVLVSTDKAVHPTSVMGATKRMAELYVRAMNNRTATRFSLVRFGNVLGSACSVLPIWARQLSEGGPITVTDERMTRYFMTIPEAAGLVIEAASLDDGEVFVLDMGEPVRIAHLATRYLASRGINAVWPDRPVPPGPGVAVRVTGARPGEKLHEELAYSGEELVPTDLPGVLTWPGDRPETAAVGGMIADLQDVRSDDSPEEVVSTIRRWVRMSTPDIATRERIGIRAGVSATAA